MTTANRARDEADLAMLADHCAGRAIPRDFRRRFMQIRDDDIRHDPTAARFWATHPLKEDPRDG